MPPSQDQTSSIDKSGICSWSEGKITDNEVAALFYPFIPIGFNSAVMSICL
ncbi:hypothetical protein DYY67_0195 [Candidatus Nitrosotalea sp. TS]|nr:hypothetical protein [Candidatus Nitrosotalea sp. TS]